jgi:cbb3-type cytochrome oxidase subunit 3
VKKALILIVTLIAGLIIVEKVTLAATGDDVIGPVNVPGNFPGAGVTSAAQAQEKLTEFVRGLIRVAFLIGGVGVLFFFAIGGIRWIFSGGDKQQIDQAKSMITAALVGFAILALSYLVLLLIGTFFKVPIVQKPPPKTCANTCPPDPASRGYVSGVDRDTCLIKYRGTYCQTSDCTDWCDMF